MSFNLPYSEYQLDQNLNKKRQATLGKPKLVNEDWQMQQPPTIDTIETEKQKRMNRVNELLNNTNNTNNDETEMGNYQPIPNPILNQKPIYDNNTMPEPIKYSSSIIEEPKFGNYHQIYKQPLTHLSERKPYYANMGISLNGTSEMDKIIEKLNYMTHLLEEQKNEKTNNIGEEFVLYTFLGVFIIYVVDSFSRAGKYIR